MAYALLLFGIRKWSRYHKITPSNAKNRPSKVFYVIFVLQSTSTVSFNSHRIWSSTYTELYETLRRKLTKVKLHPLWYRFHWLDLLSTLSHWMYLKISIFHAINQASIVNLDITLPQNPILARSLDQNKIRFWNPSAWHLYHDTPVWKHYLCAP